MSTTVQEAVAPSAEGTGDTKMLAGFAGFGSFMQETSVQTLVTQRDSDYKAPTLPISTDPCDYEFNVSWPICFVIAWTAAPRHLPCLA